MAAGMLDGGVVAPGLARDFADKPGWMYRSGAGPRLRVLHVAEAFGGGLLEVVRLIAERGAADGHEMAIAYGTRPETPDDVRSAIDESVELFPIDWRRGDPRSHASAGRALSDLVARWRPDIVHLHSSFAGAVGALVLPSEIPTIFTPHAFASSVPTHSRAHRVAFARVERMVVRRATLVGAVSESEGERARLFGARDVVVVPNGIAELDEPVPSVTKTPRSRPVVVAAGRMIGQRRPLECADILGALTSIADVRWLGGGGDDGEWGAGARRALESAGVEVTGWLPRPELLAQLRDADAYLHWTSWDGMPLSVLEAMAVDTVVVASDIAPNRELLHRSQLCATERDAVATLRRVVEQPFIADGLRHAQRRRRARYSAAEMVRGWDDTYASLVQRPLAVPYA